MKEIYTDTYTVYPFYLQTRKYLENYGWYKNLEKSYADYVFYPISL